VERDSAVTAPWLGSRRYIADVDSPSTAVPVVPPPPPRRRSRTPLLVGAAVLALALLAALLVGLNRGDDPALEPGPAAAPLPPAAPATPVQVGPSRALPADFLGANGANVRARRGTWSDPTFLSTLADLQPQNIRLFGGTTANYWDWRAGGFVSGPGVPREIAKYNNKDDGKDGEDDGTLSLETLAGAVKAGGSAPVYDLNMLTSTLEEQLAMLRAAKSLGLPVERVELGNEFYLDSGSNKLNVKVFPDGAAYGTEATRWISAIKAEFPAAKVAVLGATSRNPAGTIGNNPRRNGWNASLLSTVRGEDAVTFHNYFPTGLKPEQEIDSPATAAAVTDAARLRLQQLRAEDLTDLPDGVEAWVTEWNLLDDTGRAQGRWVHGLAVAVYGAGLLAEPDVTLTDVHSLVGSIPTAAVYASGKVLSRLPGVAETAPANKPWDLSATGVGMRPLWQVVDGRDRVAALTVADAPGVSGVVATGGRGGAAVFVNTADTPVTVAVPEGVAADAAVQQWSAAPGLLVAGDTGLTTVGGTVRGGRVELPPYSMTTLGA